MMPGDLPRPDVLEHGLVAGSGIRRPHVRVGGRVGAAT
jgi:hypothetical protein